MLRVSVGAAAVLLQASAGLAQTSPQGVGIENVYHIDGAPFDLFEPRVPTGTDYSVHHLLGNTNNQCFFQYGTPRDDTVTWDTTAETTTTYATNGVTPVISEQLQFLGGGLRLLTINSASDNGGDLYPGGFSGGGLPLTSLCYFIGIDDRLTWGPPDSTTVVAADITFFQGTTPIGPFNITSFFNNPWNGFLGLSFGGGAGIGITGVQTNLTITKIPEPASLALLGLGAIGLIRRRR